MFSCIYCLKSEPAVRPSEAHIFPDAMGGVSTSVETVCNECNHQINRSFEQDEVDKFSFFQSVWGVKNRRGKVKGVRATVEHAGKKFEVSLDARGVPKTPLIIVNEDAHGKKFYDILGPESLVEKKQKEIERRIPKIEWKEKDLRSIPPPESVIEIASDLKRISLRRLAAKVAYERWGQLRNSVLLNDKQFENVREFVFAGKEVKPCCGIFADRQILEGMLNFPAGYHGVFIFAHPNSRALGSFVSFYGLFCFWVVLSTEFQALSPIDEARLEDPQTQTTLEPLLRAKAGNLLIDWNRIAKPYLSEPDKTAFLALKYAHDKFQEVSTRFYDSKKVKHVLA
jgi:HNH endonuclease